MVKYKMLVLRASNDESSIKHCYIKDFMATRLSRKKFEAMQALNDNLKDWDYVDSKDVDFTWWDKCFKKLTPSYIMRAEFECDFYGNVSEV